MARRHRGYSPVMDMNGKTALVTGAGSGIGRATAVRLAALGAAVAVVGHSKDSAAEVVGEISSAGGTAVALAAEMGATGSVEGVFAEVARHWDKLDIVVANAGVNGVWAPLDELTEQEWTRTLTVNLTGTFLTVKHALPLLRAAGGGAVVVTASVNGTRMFSNTGATAYSASKAGQVAFTKMAALELARDRIRVNVVCPGRIDTEIEDNTEHRDLEGLRPRIELPDGEIPLTGNRAGTADQVAELITFLASDAASHITGTEVWIDGAQSLLVG